MVLLILAVTLGAQPMISLNKPDERNDNGSGTFPQQGSVAAEDYCNNGEIVFKFDSNLKLNYTETQVCVSKSGSLLLVDKNSDIPKFYISDKGKVAGPFKEGDLRLDVFECLKEQEDPQSKYVIENEGKYYISFAGKKYGPYASVTRFAATRDGSRFIALTLKDGFTGGFDMKDIEDLTKKMEGASPEEQIAIAMELGKKMEKQVTENTDQATQVVTNIPGVAWAKEMGQNFNNSIKNNEICLVRDDGSILDLTGKVIFSNPDNTYYNYDNFWINTKNNLRAWIEYGTLRFSDGKAIENVFSPIVQTEGGIDFLSYFYYSPKEDAIMRCKIQF